MKQPLAVKRCFATRKMKNVRFASWRQSRRFTEAARLLLHIRIANASLTKLWNSDIIISTNKFQKPLDFPHSFGIMCVTTRKERENDRLKAILSSKINLSQKPK